MKNVSKIGDHISIDEAKEMIFADNPHTDFTQARVFGKSQLYKILKKQKCHGVRIYIAKDPDPENAGLIDLIIVGIDAQGNDMTDLKSAGMVKSAAASREASSTSTDTNILNRGIPCPPKCIETT
jgi:hypothetical protein